MVQSQFFGQKSNQDNHRPSDFLIYKRSLEILGFQPLRFFAVKSVQIFEWIRCFATLTVKLIKKKLGCPKGDLGQLFLQGKFAIERLITKLDFLRCADRNRGVAPQLAPYREGVLDFRYSQLFSSLPFAPASFGADEMYVFFLEKKERHEAQRVDSTGGCLLNHHSKDSFTWKKNIPQTTILSHLVFQTIEMLKCLLFLPSSWFRS